MLLKGNHMYSRQKGITLLEVLVGFVIFTSSLVAVLDYVSGQVYHYHLSYDAYQKVQMIYDLTEVSKIGIEQQLIQADHYYNYNWTVSTLIMDSFSQKDKEKILQQSTHSVSNESNTFVWDVLNISEVN